MAHDTPLAKPAVSGCCGHTAPFDGATPVEYPRHFVTAAGLVSTTGDVLRFANALDGDALLRPETRRLMFSPARSPDGRALAYGLGWFVQQRRGVTVLWHYGWDRANSTLLIKVPERGVRLCCSATRRP